jgi:hypothetical protein
LYVGTVIQVASGKHVMHILHRKNNTHR